MSSHDAYAEPERGRTLTVVLLALLILTVIGALVGFVLGNRAKGDAASGPDSGQSPRPSTNVSTQGASPKATPCPAFMETAIKQRDSNAALPLALQLYIRTDKREVWICREADTSGLWYQGHDKRRSFSGVDGSGETPVEGDNGLLLSSVTFSGSVGNDKYTATNGATTYTVSRDKLAVSGNQTLSDDVRESFPKK
ncbi:hypothetical protein [Dactylosporangium sp. NPDC005555]|uniref:hypothetical protein n=1 Tax=Dactylosporangium sp. NPDC005555 TaxID=3154889 RepID=UPI0033B09865